MSYDIKLILDVKAELAETPIWHPDREVLYWTDAFAGDFHIFDPINKNDITYNLDGMIGSAIPCENGKVLVLLDTGLKQLDLNTNELMHLIDPEPDNDANRLNDGRCDVCGRVWLSTVSKLFGTDEYEASMTGALYMVDKDLSVNKVLDSVNQLNGIGWSIDNKYMYVVDTYNFKLLSFEYDIKTGHTGVPKTAISIPQAFGYADGMCVDSEDYVWIAHWGSKLSRWNPKTGDLIEAVDMPVPNITCCNFGGVDFDELYITTSMFGIDEEDLKKQPLSMSGGILKMKTGVKGRESYMFKG